MFARRSQLSTVIRRPIPGRLVLLLPLIVAILAACNPGSGGGSGY